MQELTIVKTVDATTLRCPEPLMLIRKEIRSVAIDEIILVIADDPTTKVDVVNFCQFMGHALLQQETDAKPFKYWIQKQK